MSIDRDLQSESSLDPLDPRLPHELEREIFLYAIQHNIADIPKFQLFPGIKTLPQIHGTSTDLISINLSTDLFERSSILPIVFNVVVVFHNLVLPSPFPFHQPALYTYYGSHIRHLLISNSDTDRSRRKFKELSPVLYECLLRCPNLTDLALWCPQTPLTSLAGLTKLTHLALDVDCLLGLLPPLNINSGSTTTTTTTPTSVLFPNVTHLNMLLKVSITTPQCESFIHNLNHHFPSLTHLAHSRYLWEDTTMKSLLELTLRTLEKLEVLALWRSGANEAVRLDERPLAEWLVRNKRVLALVIGWEKAWEEEARKTGLGIWTFADQVMEERENGQTT